MLFPNPEKALNRDAPGGEAWRQSRSDGLCSAGEESVSWDSSGDRSPLRKHTPPAPGEPWMFALGAPGVLEGVYREAGFQNVSVHAAPIPRRFPSAAAAVGNMRKGCR